MSYGTSITLDAPFAQTVTRVREALKEQGFGVLTEIDMRVAMREKLGVEIEDYLVLGACNPPLAYRALGVDRSIGLLLPCNVVVRAAHGRTVVEALDPQVMVTLTAEPAITPIAEEASRRLRQALDSLAS
ncbi:MAG TPA: DUF302 domain-containing protein [Kineosporiaceae bacterium]|nr:DUF302 domain-containing protein [Kineosporiaceae bacterium]